MFITLFYAHLTATAQEILFMTRNAKVRNDAWTRTQCQRILSTFCGQWNEFTRRYRITSVPRGWRAKILNEYAQMAKLIDQIEDYDFQERSLKKFHGFRKNVTLLVKKLQRGTKLTRKCEATIW